jgi:hypothetical protein
MIIGYIDENNGINKPTRKEYAIALLEGLDSMDAPNLLNIYEFY